MERGTGFEGPRGTLYLTSLTGSTLLDGTDSAGTGLDPDAGIDPFQEAVFETVVLSAMVMDAR